MTLKKQKTLKVSGFIQKLIALLKSSQCQGVIQYNSEERSFTIKNVRKFTQQILPKYFKHKNFSSFVRQVNLYDFHKIKQEGKQQVYRHQNFDINQHKLLRKIKRKPMNRQKQKVQNPRNSQQQQSESEQIQTNRENNIKDQQEYVKQLNDKKKQLQDKIQLQYQANQKLQDENTKMKNTYIRKNMDFYKEILRILQNILVSQMNQNAIPQSLYQSIIYYIYQQKKRLKIQDQNILDNYRQAKNYGVKIQMTAFVESKFLSFIKQLLIQKKNQLTIPNFVTLLYKFIEEQANINLYTQGNQNTQFTNNQQFNINKPIPCFFPSTQKSQQKLIPQVSNNFLVQNNHKNHMNGVKHQHQIKNRKKHKKKEQSSSEQYIPKGNK